MSNVLIRRECCPICMSTDSNTLYSEKYNSEFLSCYFSVFYGSQGYPDVNEIRDYEFILKECKSCDFLYQEYVPGPYFMEKLYSVWIDEAKAMEQYELFRPEFKMIDNFLLILRAIRYHNRRNLRIFDFGFGYCHLLRQGMLFGMSAFGVEQNTKQIGYAKKLGIAIMEPEHGISPKMDVVFCEQVFEHLIDPKLVVQQILKLCDSQTLVHISTPDSKHVKKVIKKFTWLCEGKRNRATMPFAPLEHINCFTYASLVNLMVKSGFKVVNVGDFNINPTNSVSLLQLISKVWFLIKGYIRDVFGTGRSTELFFKLDKPIK